MFERCWLCVNKQVGFSCVQFSETRKSSRFLSEVCVIIKVKVLIALAGLDSLFGKSCSRPSIFSFPFHFNSLKEKRSFLTSKT